MGRERREGEGKGGDRKRGEKEGIGRGKEGERGREGKREGDAPPPLTQIPGSAPGSH